MTYYANKEEKIADSKTRWANIEKILQLAVYFYDLLGKKFHDSCRFWSKLIKLNSIHFKQA